jgi:hypothetical protein
VIRGPNDGPEGWIGANSPLIVAALATVFVLGLVAVLAYSPVETGNGIASRWLWFSRLAPNEMGDALAGIFSCLTLVWIIASVFHQSKELRQQRKEFSAMADAQKAQVIALEAQTEILKDEKRRRDELEADEEFGEFENVLINSIRNENLVTSLIVLSKEAASPGLETCNFSVFQDPNLLRTSNDLRHLLREVTWSVCVVLSNTVRAHAENGYTFVEDATFEMAMQRIVDLLIEMQQLRSRMSPAGKVRSSELDLSNTIESLAKTLALYRSGFVENNGDAP